METARCRASYGSVRQRGDRTVKARQPDAVILDVLLPDQKGLDVYAELRDIDPRLPVIFITGGGTSATAIEAMQLGALGLPDQTARFCPRPTTRRKGLQNSQADGRVG